MKILVCVAGLTGLGMTGVLPEKVKGLLVDRRLSTPAGQPGAQLVIVTGQQMLVMPARPRFGGAATPSGRGRRGAGRLHPGRARPVAGRELQPPSPVSELRAVGGRPPARLPPHRSGVALDWPGRGRLTRTAG